MFTTIYNNLKLFEHFSFFLFLRHRFLFCPFSSINIIKVDNYCTLNYNSDENKNTNPFLINNYKCAKFRVP